jgi:recombination protein RecA
MTDTLSKVVAELRKQFGERILLTLDDEPMTVPVIPTGSLAIDRALGVGGVPRSRITEIYGPEGGGKTTLALHITAEAQGLGGTAVYIDMEHGVDLAYMAAIGVDTSAVLFSQPNSGIDALNVIRKLVTSNTVDLIVVDSVAALSAPIELDADAGDQFMGVQARMLSQNLKAIAPILGLSKTALVLTNQTRMKIGVMYGNPETTSGGYALKFYSSIRMRIAKVGMLGPKGKEYGIRSRVRVTKNKVACPWQQAEFDLVWGKGISREADVLAVALDTDVVSQAGGWFSYGETKLGHGREAAKEYLAANPDLVAELREKVLRGG